MNDIVEFSDNFSFSKDRSAIQYKGSSYSVPKDFSLIISTGKSINDRNLETVSYPTGMYFLYHKVDKHSGLREVKPVTMSKVADIMSDAGI